MPCVAKILVPRSIGRVKIILHISCASRKEQNIERKNIATQSRGETKRLD